MNLGKSYKKFYDKLTPQQAVAFEWAAWALLAVLVFFVCFYIARAINQANFDEAPYQPESGEQLELVN